MVGLEKKFRVIQTTICEKHKRVSIILVDVSELNPRNIIRPPGQETMMKQINGKMVYLTPLTAMDLHNHRGYITLDITPEEYEKFGSPTVGQTVETVFKAGK